MIPASQCRTAAYTDAELDAAIAAITDPARLREAQEPGRPRRAVAAAGAGRGAGRGRLVRLRPTSRRSARPRREDDPRERAARGADAARRGDPAGDAGRRGGRLRAGAASSTSRRAMKPPRRTDRRWKCAFSATPASRSPTATRRVLIDPFLTGNPKAAIAADDVAATTILLTHGHEDHYGDTVAIAKRTGATGRGDHRARRRDRRGGRRRPRPQPRRHRQVRLGLGQARPRLAHLDHAEGHGQHARRPADQLRGHDRLPPRRHVPVLRPAAGRQARTRSTSR